MSENKKKKKDKSKDKELICDKASRRDARLGTIISIIAILAAFCSLLFRCTKSVITVFPESGYLYYILMWSIFLIPLSATVLICLDIILYVIADLNRYNVKDEHYKDYDKESDNKYSSMINDFKIMLGVFIVVVYLMAMLDSISQKNIGGVFTVIIGVSLFVVAMIKLIVKIVRKEIVWKKIGDIIQRLFVLLVIMLIILAFVWALISSKPANVDVTFDEKGNIVIENAIDEDFGSASLCIFDEADCLIKKVNITEDAVLRAKESTGQRLKNNNGDEIGMAQKLSREMLYWKYQYNINELELADGKYCVMIDIIQNQRTVRIANMFEVDNTVFSFGRNSIYKEY